MKVRLTPLNLATAFFLIIALYSWVYGVKISGLQYHRMSGIIGWIFILFAIVVSFMDLMFRNFLVQTKKIWIVELSFLTLVAVIFLIVK